MDALGIEEVGDVLAVTVQELQPVGVIGLNGLTDIDVPGENKVRLS